MKICTQINQSCKQILQTPIFCLRKFEGLSERNRKDWIKVIQSVETTDKTINIISYLKWNLTKNVLVNLPCYSSTTVQEDFRNKILECCKKKDLSDEDIEIVKILVPLTDDPNASDKHGRTPIHWAAKYGYTEIVKFLAHLTDNPNASDLYGDQGATDKLFFLSADTDKGQYTQFSYRPIPITYRYTSFHIGRYQNRYRYRISSNISYKNAIKIFFPIKCNLELLH